MEFRYHKLNAADDEKVVRVETEGELYRVTVGERTYTVEVQQPEHGRLNMKIDGRRVRAYVASDGLRRYVAFNSPCNYVLQQPDRGRPDAGARCRPRPAGWKPRCRGTCWTSWCGWATPSSAGKPSCCWKR